MDVTITRKGTADSWTLTARAEGMRAHEYKVTRRYPMTAFWTVATRGGVYVDSEATLADAVETVRAHYVKRMARKA